MSVVEAGQTVNVHYVGTFDDGAEFDSSRGRNQTLTFQVGSGQMVSGFDAALVGMEVGEKKNIHLSPAEAYGDINPDAVQTVPLTAFPEDFKPVANATVYGQNESGQKILARVKDFDTHTATLDLNHPLAGKSLNFEIELVSVG